MASGYEAFDDLIRRLRDDGHAEAAAKLHGLFHGVAWTTSSELIGELGQAIRSFERDTPVVGAELRRRLDASTALVRDLRAELEVSAHTPPLFPSSSAAPGTASAAPGASTNARSVPQYLRPSARRER
jgi:hypothetical protein